MATKLDTLKWFLQRPQYWTHALDIASSKFKPNRELQRPEATEWARSNSIPLQEAFKNLKIKPAQPIRILFNDVFKKADNQAAACPVEMGGEGALDLLYNLALSTLNGNFIETGVAHGWSSLALLLALKERGNNQLFSIDLPYLQKDNDQWVGCVIPQELRKSWVLLRGSDRMLLRRALQKSSSIALVHYDSDKSYYGRKWAYPIIWIALAKGGYFISDDIQDNFAFKEFCADQKLKPLIIQHLDKYVGVLKK